MLCFYSLCFIILLSIVFLKTRCKATIGGLPIPLGSHHSHGVKSFQLQVYMILFLRTTSVNQESMQEFWGIDATLNQWHGKYPGSLIPLPSFWITPMQVNCLAEYPRGTEPQYPTVVNLLYNVPLPGFLLHSCNSPVVLRGMMSHINDVHSHPCVRFCFEGTQLKTDIKKVWFGSHNFK